MAVFAATNTFVSGQVITASGHNTNWSDVTTWLNNRYNGTDTWLNMKVSATATNPVDISGSGASTELSINNSATDGDPLLTFKLSGSQIAVLGVDDSDSDILKFGTSSITANVSMQIPAAGSQVQFAAGTVAAPSISIIGSATSGIYSSTNNQIDFSISGVQRAAISSSGMLVVGRVFISDGTVGSPVVAFNSEDSTGLFRPGAGSIGIAVSGAQVFASNGADNLSSLNLIPNADNSVSCGKNGSRWTAVWAANGSIQTSISSSKKEIQSIQDVDIKIPDAISFLRPEDNHNSKQIGFLADGLPEECFAVIDENGTRSTTDVYTSAVIGILCAAIKKLEARLAEAGIA